SWGCYVMVVRGQFVGIGPGAERVAWALVAALILAVVVGRFGLLATMSAWFAWMVWSVAPLTTDLSAWYARQGVAAALVVIGLAVYGFVVSGGAKRLALRGFFGEGGGGDGPAPGRLRGGGGGRPRRHGHRVRGRLVTVLVIQAGGTSARRSATPRRIRVEAFSAPVLSTYALKPESAARSGPTREWH